MRNELHGHARAHPSQQMITRDQCTSGLAGAESSVWLNGLPGIDNLESYGEAGLQPRLVLAPKGDKGDGEAGKLK